MKKRYLLVILTAFIMCFLPFMSCGKLLTSTTTVHAQSVGWQKVNGTWYYYNASGLKQIGWLKEGNTWYYLKSNGAMATGWEKVNGTWYYLEPSGEMKTGWLKEGSIWYYLKPSGAMATGWAKDGDTYYYFEQSGAMKTGWLKEGSTWYYLKPSGVMATGWAKDGNTYYYFEKSGAMKTGWLKEGSTWYYLKPSGAMATGWEKVNNVWYYFYNSGVMATNTVIDGWSINGNGVATNQQPIFTGTQVINQLANEGFYVSQVVPNTVFWSSLGPDITPALYDVSITAIKNSNTVDLSIVLTPIDWDNCFAYTRKALNKVIPSGTSTIMNAVSNVKSGTWKFDGRTVSVRFGNGYVDISISPK